jgi:hypothetical protein
MMGAFHSGGELGRATKVATTQSKVGLRRLAFIGLSSPEPTQAAS